MNYKALKKLKNRAMELQNAEPRPLVPKMVPKPYTPEFKQYEGDKPIFMNAKDYAQLNDMDTDFNVFANSWLSKEQNDIPRQGSHF